MTEQTPSRKEQILQALAHMLEAEPGGRITTAGLAREVGVSEAALYRHFPTREHLVESVYRRELEILATAARDLMREEEPAKAIEEWMNRFVSYMAAKKGMASSLKLLFTSNSALFAEGSKLLHTAFEELLDNAVKADAVKGDIEGADVLNALFGIYSIPESPEWRDRAHRIVRLVMDGLRR